MQNQLPVWEMLAKEMIWNQIGFLEDKDILDFGSGNGATADYYAAGNRVTAVEPSKEVLSGRIDTNGYRQLIGSTDELKKLNGNSFDFIFCHNVLEYAPDREDIVNEFYRLLKPGGKLSVVKHNRAGRVMQMVVLLNNFGEANRLLDGRDGTAQKYGSINYFDDNDIRRWRPGFKLLKTYGLRTFWDLQQNQDIQKDSQWQRNMLEIETRVSENTDFQKIAFFHHLIFERREQG